MLHFMLKILHEVNVNSIFICKGIPHAADALFYYDVVLPNGTLLADDEVKMKNILLDSLVAFTETG